jgi:serine/threonine protein kinase
MADWIREADLEADGRVLIGKGSFGSVFRGIFYHMEEVAVKVLLDSADDQTETAFLEEIKLLMRLRSPRVVQTFGGCVRSEDHGQKQMMIVMKFISGGTLYDKIREQPLIGWPARLMLAVDIAAGMEYLHGQGIIHRDLKSLNVLVDVEGRAILCDFGLARVKRSSRSTATSSGQGTPLWMAPELFGRRARYTEASDIYALAMVMVELSTGLLPFEELLETEGLSAFEQVPLLLAQRARPAIPATNPGLTVPESVPLLVQAFIQTAWAHEPESRPKASQCVEQLKGAQGEGSSRYA